jgi:hypothetical protein
MIFVLEAKSLVSFQGGDGFGSYEIACVEMS